MIKKLFCIRPVVKIWYNEFFLLLIIAGSVADPDHFDADPDPTSEKKPDPDPTMLYIKFCNKIFLL
jgi:hypothetical protein